MVRVPGTGGTWHVHTVGVVIFVLFYELGQPKALLERLIGYAPLDNAYFDVIF